MDREALRQLAARCTDPYVQRELAHRAHQPAHQGEGQDRAAQGEVLAEFDLPEGHRAREVLAEAGAQVEAGAALIRLEDEEDAAA